MSEDAFHKNRPRLAVVPTDNEEGDPLRELARLIGQDDPLDYPEPGRNDPTLHAIPVDRAGGLRGSLDIPVQHPLNEFPDLDQSSHHESYPHLEEAGRNVDPAVLAYGVRAGEARLEDFQDHWDYEDVPRVMSGGLRPNGLEDPANFQVDGNFAGHAAPMDEDMDLQPHRRGFSVVFGGLMLAILIAGSVLGYRFLSNGSSGEPPLVLADAGPLKIPAAPDAAGIKPSTDRAVAPSKGHEQIVGREETPVDVAKNIPDQPIANPAPRVIAPVGSSSEQSAESQPDPRKVRTEIVRNNAPASASTPVLTPASPPAARTTPSQRPHKPVQPVGPMAISPQSAPADSQSTAWRAPNFTEPQPAASSSATQARQAARSSVAPATSSGGDRAFAIQVSSQKSEEAAQVSLRQAQSKYGSALSDGSVVRADLGAKGIYYRVMFGAYASQGEAAQACASLKARGGDCVVARRK